MPPSISQVLPQAEAEALISLYTQGRFAEVLERGEALRGRFPRAGALLNILGAASLGLCRFEGAATYFRAALDVNPGDAGAHNNLGLTLHDLGRPEEAVASYRRALAIKADYVEAQNNLGNALYALGRDDEAIGAYRQAVTIAPGYAEAQNNLGVLFQKKGKSSEAMAHFRMALQIYPDYADAHINLGNAQKDLGDVAGALASYNRALAIAPHAVNAHFNLGNTLRLQGDRQAAMDAYRHVLALQPAHTGALNNLGSMLQDFNRNAEALATYEAALVADPNYAEAHYNMGRVLQSLGRSDESIASYRNAIALNPSYVEAYYNLGSVLQERKQAEEAIVSYDRALALKPDYNAVLTNRIHAQLSICAWKTLEADTPRIPALGIEGDVVSPFALFGLEDNPGRHLIRARRYSAERYAAPQQYPARPARGPRPLRVAYFSTDFRNHPVAHLVSRLLERHDRSAVTVYAYAYGPPSEDEARHRIMRAADVFRDVGALDDHKIVQSARQDEIDIAVDLTGFTQGVRANIFALRAAPVQINYLGYPGTMGAGFMDYILADKVAIPENSQRHYAEKAIYLPHCYLPTDDTVKIPDQRMSRSQAGLPEHGFVFCCFNNIYKITPQEFDIWMRLLRKVDGSVLWLNTPNATAQANLKREAQSRGVDPDRLIFAAYVPQAAYHARLAAGDLFLDTFLYNAHSTAVDAMRAGLPMLTKIGEGFPARAAGSVLTAMGLPELIVATPEDYENAATELALHPGKLAALRDRLSRHRLDGPLFDTARFARHMESAFAQAYARYAAGEEPAVIEVQAAQAAPST